MLNVNRQYGHLGGKMRGVIQSNLRAAGYALMPLTPLPASAAVRRDEAPAFSPPPSMISTHHTEPQSAPPRHCVRVIGLESGRVMVMSFDNEGAVVERYEGPHWMVTDLKLKLMHENLDKAPPAELPPLKLL